MAVQGLITNVVAVAVSMDDVLLVGNVCPSKPSVEVEVEVEEEVEEELEEEAVDSGVVGVVGVTVVRILKLLF